MCFFFLVNGAHDFFFISVPTSGLIHITFKPQPWLVFEPNFLISTNKFVNHGTWYMMKNNNKN